MRSIHLVAAAPRAALLFAALHCCSGASRAQCSALADPVPGTRLALGDEDVRTVALGFAFPWQGVTYDAISIASNGFVWLGQIQPELLQFVATDYLVNEPDLLAWGPRIAVCWRDWNPASPQVQPGDGVFFRSDGSVASVVWRGVPAFAPAHDATRFAHMELVLDHTGRIDLDFGTAMAVPADDCIVGISAGGGVAGNSLDWTALQPVAVAGGTGYELFAGASFDLVGQDLALAPVDTTATGHVALLASLPACAPAVHPPAALQPQAFGQGCPPLAVQNSSAIYERFTPIGGGNPLDLSGRSVRFVRAGSSYVALPGPGFDSSYLTHGVRVPQDDETLARGLSVGAMGTFPFATATVATVDAAANGYLMLQPGGQSHWIPTAARLMFEGARIAPLWSDYDLFLGGAFWWQNDDPAFCMATWEQVPHFGQPASSNTFQCKLFANGDIVFAWGAVGSTVDDLLAGIALGNGGADPGGSDLSAVGTAPVLRDLGSLVLPLDHRVSGPAALGTHFALAVEHLPAGASFGFFALGVTARDIDLGAAGMTGCHAYLDLLDTVSPFVPGDTAMSQGFLLPIEPAFYGVTLYSQAVALAPVNPFGVVTSNRVGWTLGR
ncbi:MAG: hypothetical protein AB7O97_06980 [Planctomycetota bacterium]